MTVDYLTVNDQGGLSGFGSVAERLLAHNGDFNALRPYSNEKGQGTFINVRNAEGKYEAKFVSNAPATLRKDQWKLIDDAVVESAKPRLRFVADLRAAGMQTVLENGMSRVVLEYETMGDISPATISMDGMRESERDRPEFDIRGIPLPIIHKDFWYSTRQILVSRQGGTPLDTTTARLAGRKCAEEAEKLALGVSSSYSYAGYTVYGLTNFPSRNTHTMTLPTDGGWTGTVFVSEILAMIAKSQADQQYGPWMLYHSPSWSPYLDADYSATKGDNTLRQRTLQIDGISGMRVLDYLTGYQMILMQMTSDQADIIVGMEFTTLQWESHGGMRQNFKVLGIIVPRFRSDPDGNSGIVHGVAA
jgi:hypothetical protein